MSETPQLALSLSLSLSLTSVSQQSLITTCFFSSIHLRADSRRVSAVPDRAQLEHVRGRQRVQRDLQGL